VYKRQRFNCMAEITVEAAYAAAAEILAAGDAMRQGVPAAPGGPA